MGTAAGLLALLLPPARAFPLRVGGTGSLFTARSLSFNKAGSPLPGTGLLSGAEELCAPSAGVDAVVGCSGASLPCTAPAISLDEAGWFLPACREPSVVVVCATLAGSCLSNNWRPDNQVPRNSIPAAIMKSHQRLRPGTAPPPGISLSSNFLISSQEGSTSPGGGKLCSFSAKCLSYG